MRKYKSTVSSSEGKATSIQMYALIPFEPCEIIYPSTSIPGPYQLTWALSAGTNATQTNVTALLILDDTLQGFRSHGGDTLQGFRSHGPNALRTVDSHRVQMRAKDEASDHLHPNEASHLTLHIAPCEGLSIRLPTHPLRAVLTASNECELHLEMTPLVTVMVCDLRDETTVLSLPNAHHVHVTFESDDGHPLSAQVESGLYRWITRFPSTWSMAFSSGKGEDLSISYLETGTRHGSDWNPGDTKPSPRRARVLIEMGPEGTYLDMTIPSHRDDGPLCSEETCPLDPHSTGNTFVSQEPTCVKDTLDPSTTCGMTTFPDEEDVIYFYHRVLPSDIDADVLSTESSDGDVMMNFHYTLMTTSPLVGPTGYVM